MNILNIYKLGQDSPPVEGSVVVLYDKDTYHCTLTSTSLKEGVILYSGTGTLQYGDPDYDDYGHLIGNYVCVGCTDGYLLEGQQWSYAHEYYAIVGDEDTFAFQDFAQFKVAVTQGWCEVKDELIKVGMTKEEAEAELSSYKGYHEGHSSLIKNTIHYLMQDTATYEVVWNDKVWGIRFSGEGNYFTYANKEVNK